MIQKIVRVYPPHPVSAFSISARVEETVRIVQPTMSSGEGVEEWFGSLFTNYVSPSKDQSDFAYEGEGWSGESAQTKDDGMANDGVNNETNAVVDNGNKKTSPEHDDEGWSSTFGIQTSPATQLSTKQASSLPSWDCWFLQRQVTISSITKLPLWHVYVL